LNGAGLLTGQGLLGVAGFLAHSLAGPYTRDASYSGNRVGPRASPPADAILQAYWAGRFGDPDSIPARTLRDTLLNEHGIYWGESLAIKDKAFGTFLGERGAGWQSYVDLSKPFPPAEMLLDASRRGLYAITTDEVIKAYRRQGITDPRWLLMLTDMGLSLDATQAVQAFYRGNLPGTRDEQISTLRQMLLVAGYTDDQIAEVIRLLGERPAGLIDAVQLANRDMIDPAELERQIQLNGVDPSLVPLLAQLRYQIPGPGDLVRFAVREVWDASTVTEFGYDEEFPAEFNRWLRA